MGQEHRQRDTHDHQKSRCESSEIDDSGSGRFHKIVGIGAAGADPVGEGSDDVGCHDEEGEVGVEEGGGEDDEEEAYCQDLGYGK